MRDAYYGQRVGIDLTRSGNTFTAKYYVETKGSVYYNGLVLDRSGAIDGNVGFNWNTGGASTLLVNTATKTGSPGNSYTFQASVSLPWWGGKCSVSRSGSIPIATPNAPTSVTLSRSSDTALWFRAYFSDSSSRPVQGIQVERWSYADPVWRRVLNWTRSGGSPLSWIDKGVTANNRYQYRARTTNSSGQSGWVNSPRVSTTPAAPSNVVATKNADGSITVTWQKNTPNGLDGAGYLILDNGTQVGTTPPGTLVWTDPSPSTSVTHTYTIQMTENGPLTSAPSAPSNTVQLLAAPNAPGNLSPNGGVIAFESTSFRLAWAHNPVDASEQTSAQYRFRAQGTSTWSTGSATTDQFVEVSSALFTPGTVYEWQVRTRGAYQPSAEAGFSPWSAVATFSLMNTPGASISTPEDGSTVNVSRMTVKWTYFQSQGRAQAGAEVQLVQDPEGDTPITRESHTVSGAATSLLLTTALADQTTYMVRVRVRSGDGLWSDWDESTFTVSYPQPPVPQVGIDWDGTQGAAQVSVFNPDPEGTEPPAVYNTVERSIDGGGTWELVMDDIPINGTVTDPECLSYGETLYRVTAVSALPSSSTSDALTFNPQDESAWINAGTNFATSAHIPSNLRITRSLGKLNRTLVPIEGREYGMLVEGVAKDHTVTVYGDVPVDVDNPWESDQIIQSLDAIADVPNPAMLRLPDGTRWYGALTSYSRTNPEQDRTATVSIAFERGNRE